MKAQKYIGNWFVFDIETTGFFPESSLVTAIGLKNIEKEKIIFLESVSKEIEILKELLDFLRKENVNTLIGFNLLNFDIPYLKGKFLINNLDFSIFSEIQIIDLSEILKDFKFKNKSLTYISKILFNSYNTNSDEMPKSYLEFLENKNKSKIISHLKKDLENTFLLAKRLNIIS